MAKAIWKFSIDSFAEQIIELPFGTKILSVMVQNEQPFLWAEVDTRLRNVPRRINVYATGQDMQDNPGDYIGSFMLSGGSLVFHVYDATRIGWKSDAG